MELYIQNKLNEDIKMSNLLKQNSYWFKYLNRDSNNYLDFIKDMKNKYHLNMSDKISDAIDNIDIISSVLETLK
jgi:membrane-anchored protein YejM (alkaline phosphatase superfamily)